MNVNAKCVKQNGVLLSAAKNMIKLDKLFNKQQHARCGTLNGSHSYSVEICRNLLFLSTAFDCCLKKSNDTAHTSNVSFLFKGSYK